MRIDLSSDDSFFLPDRSVSTGLADSDSPKFGDLLKDLADQGGFADELAAADAEQTASELQLFVEIGPELLEFVLVNPDQPEQAIPLTAEELVELIAQTESEAAELEQILEQTGAIQATEETQVPEEQTIVQSTEPEALNQVLEKSTQAGLPEEEALAENLGEELAQTLSDDTPDAKAAMAQDSKQTLINDANPQAAIKTNPESAAETSAKVRPDQKPEAGPEAKTSQPLQHSASAAVGKSSLSEATAHQAITATHVKTVKEDGATLAENPQIQGSEKEAAALEARIPGSLDKEAGQGGADEESGDGQGTGRHSRQQLPAQSESSEGDEGEIRELNYQEIQSLVAAALEGSRQMPVRVHQLLKELLGALAEGQRWPLDQHRLIGLDQAEWQLLIELFPAHFYSGLLRQHRQSSLPLYELLQNLYQQIPPDSQAQTQLLELWQADFKSLPNLLTDWIHDRPLQSEPEQVAHFLERWQQLQTLPPGAIGRVLQLALAYRHHAEKMLALFTLSQELLHGRALNSAQAGLLAQSVSERCYPRDLTDIAQIQILLERALSAGELSESELIQVLTGCSQNVLSYLPYARISPDLQELQDYVRRDLLGHEELVPGLF